MRSPPVAVQVVLALLRLGGARGEADARSERAHHRGHLVKIRIRKNLAAIVRAIGPPTALERRRDRGASCRFGNSACSSERSTSSSVSCAARNAACSSAESPAMMSLMRRNDCRTEIWSWRYPSGWSSGFFHFRVERVAALRRFPRPLALRWRRPSAALSAFNRSCTC